MRYFGPSFIESRDRHHAHSNLDEREGAVWIVYYSHQTPLSEYK